MSTVLVVAPHPDDETLGCGGTLLRHVEDGDVVHWLIVTDMTAEGGFAAERIAAREGEIAAVAAAYGFAGVHRLGYATATLDTLPRATVIEAMSGIFRDLGPDTVYLPFPGDAHSDHRIVFEAASACTKPFRYDFVRTVLCMEIPSETNAGLDSVGTGFQPNHYVDIGAYLDRKLAIMAMYAGEMGTFPFPRSEQAIRSLAAVRGVEAGRPACEAFRILRDIR